MSEATRADARCDLCDLPRDTCAHSIPMTAVDDLDLVADGPTIEAKYGGTECVGCGKRIAKDEVITHTTDGWAHSGEVARPATVDEMWSGF